MKQFNIQFPSILENVRIVESFIDNATENYNIDELIYGDIVIAVTESVNNAIMHGNQQNRQKHVNLTLELDDHIVRFRVEDEGSGFDYENLQDPTAPENLENPGGRGIFLMKNLSDEVVFSDEGRRVELIFYMD